MDPLLVSPGTGGKMLTDHTVVARQTSRKGFLSDAQKRGGRHEGLPHILAGRSQSDGTASCGRGSAKLVGYTEP